MKSSNQTNFVYLLILIAIVAMVFLNINGNSGQDIISISEVAQLVKNGKVSEIVQDENSLVLTTDDGEKVAIKESESSLVEQLVAYGVTEEELSNVDITIQQPGPWADIRSDTE